MTKELLFRLTKKDFEVQTFRAGGKGGQNQNKTNTGVRIIHKASGARGEARDSRSQSQNKKNAFIRMTETPEFKTWLKLEIARYTKAESDVMEWMKPWHLKIETAERF